jgi:small subunit ribosomal protein S17
MKKIFEGVVVSTKMQKTAVVMITRQTPHPLYKKLIKRDRGLKADFGAFAPKEGDRVKIEEIKPMSKTKNFRIVEVFKDGTA